LRRRCSSAFPSGRTSHSAPGDALAGHGAEEREAAKEEAEEIYQKFKKGETLDTEDLMKLQKAGKL